MSDFDNLINQLEPNQMSISSKYIENKKNEVKEENKNTIYNKYIKNNKNNDYFVLNNTFPDLYYNKIKWNNNTFIYSILCIMDSTFEYMTNKIKVDIINAIKKKICYDLVERKYYHRFGYARKRKFKKEKLQKYLLDLKIDIDGEKYESVRKYIVDYFNINIILINTENDINTDIIYTERENIGYFKYRPTILLNLINKKYYPIIKKDIVNDDLYFKYENEKDLIDELHKLSNNKIIYYNNEENGEENDNFNKQEKEVKKEKEEINNNEKLEIEEEIIIIDKEKEELDISKKSLKELQVIVKQKGGDIYKISDKTGKKIKKQKKELINFLINN